MTPIEGTQETTIATASSTDGTVNDDNDMTILDVQPPLLPGLSTQIRSPKMPGVKSIVKPQHRQLAHSIIGIMNAFSDSYIEKTARDRDTSTAWRQVTECFFSGAGSSFTPYSGNNGWAKMKSLGLAILKHYSEVYEHNLATQQPIFELERSAHTMQEERMNAMEAISRNITARKQAAAGRAAVNLVYENGMGLRAGGRGPRAPRSLGRPTTQNDTNALAWLGINPRSPACK